MIIYHCAQCDKNWSYPVKRCIYCKSELEAIEESQYTVIGSTQIHVPSAGNEKIPYFVYLLECRNGSRIAWKSFEAREIGDQIDFGSAQNSGTVVGVIGTGTLGLGIAEYLLRNNKAVVLKTRTEASIAVTQAKIGKKLAKNLTSEAVNKLLSNLTITVNYSNMEDCDIVIEAALEDMGIKKGVFKELSSICGPRTIFATNTSSLSIDEIAMATDRPDRFIGIHFFNPVSKMELIEVVIGKKTSEATKEQAMAFCQSINKMPVVVRNSPGFVVNRLLLPQINDAVRLHEAGVARKEDIDAAIKMGLNHPMGPFALADLIGIDICILILNTLYDSYKEERFKPARMLIELYESGKLGIKSGEGFYKYR